MEIFNAFKGIAGMIREAIDETMPRQAVVTRSDGLGVWVRFAPVDTGTPEMWFPSTVAGLPVGTSGWVSPLAGGKGMFVATGTTTRGQTHSASRTSTAAASTTAIVASSNSYTTFTILASDTLATWIPVITDGIWDVDIVGSATVYRSVAGGGAWLAVGSDTEGGSVLSRNFTMTNGHGLVSAYSLKAVTPETLIQMRIAGWSVAGTTNYPTWAMQITARRVG